MPLLNDIHFNNLKGDLFGGVTAAVIALPMALAFGVASGAGPAAGLYGAVLVGLFAALFGSTPTLISEPTGPMTVVMTAVIASLIAANPEQGMAMAFTTVILAGVFQIIFGLLKAGKYVTMMPYSVVSGFMSGIGIILIVLQLGPFLGHATPPGGVLGTFETLPSLLSNLQINETLLAIGTLLLLTFFPKKLSSIIPPQLLALLIGTLIAIVFLGSDDLRRIGEIPTGLPEIQLPTFTAAQMGIMLTDAVVLAMLGTIDALLTSVIAENLTKKESNPDKELFGQGLGNIASGLFGGIPGAGATMGTVVNIQAGAQTALSGIARAVILLLVIMLAADLTAEIPLAVLAGIAMKVGIDIIDWSFIRRVYRVSTKATFIMIGVIGLTVFVDLIAAVAIGVFIANLLTIERFVKMHSDSISTSYQLHKGSLPRDNHSMRHSERGDILTFSLGGPLFFGLAKGISRKFATLPDKHEVLIIDLENAPLIGVSSSLAIESLALEDLSKSRPVLISGMSTRVKRRLGHLGLLDRIGEKNIFNTLDQAQARATELLNENDALKAS
jgi:SulP family sulfate permease